MRIESGHASQNELRWLIFNIRHEKPTFPLMWTDFSCGNLPMLAFCSYQYKIGNSFSIFCNLIFSIYCKKPTFRIYSTLFDTGCWLFLMETEYLTTASRCQTQIQVIARLPRLKLIDVAYFYEYGEKIQHYAPSA